MCQVSLDFAKGFATLLKPEGVATFEFPHVLNLINEVQFDTIYHEHFFYLSLVAVEKIFAADGLRVFDVEELPTHGGSLRVFACRKTAGHVETSRGAGLRAKEHAAKLDTLEGYAGFDPKVREVKRGFLAFPRTGEEGREARGRLWRSRERQYVPQLLRRDRQGHDLRFRSQP